MKNYMTIVVVLLLLMSSSIIFGMNLGGQSKVKAFASMSKAQQNLFKAKNVEAITKALKAGVDINTKNNDGVTPIFYWFDNFYVQGFNKKQDEFIKMLQVALNAGAQTNITTKDGTKTLIKWNRPLAAGVLDNLLKKERGNKKSEKLIKFLQENFKPLTAADKIDFLAKKKEFDERSSNSVYITMALEENDANLIQQVMDALREDPLYLLQLILDKGCLDRPSLIYYSLYLEHPNPKDLQFIKEKNASNKMSKLEKLYRKAQYIKCTNFTKVFDKFYEDLKSPIRKAILSDNVSDLNNVIKEQAGNISTILDGLELLASNYYLPVTFVPYLLYSLNLETKDLDFLAGNRPATDKAKILQLLYAQAKVKRNKVFGKALLDYYQKLKEGTKVFPDELVQEILLFAGNPGSVKDEEIIELEQTNK